MQRRELLGEARQGLLADQLHGGLAQQPDDAFAFELAIDRRGQLIALDDGVEPLDRVRRALDAGLVRDEDQAAELRPDRVPRALREGYLAGPDHILEDGDVLAVLFHGRGHADRLAANEALPLAPLVDRDTLGKVLALAHPDLQQAVDDEVVDLGAAATALDSQVVDGRNVGIVGIAELDLVGGFLLALGAGPDGAHILLGVLTRYRINIRAGQEHSERIEQGLLVVGALDSHQGIPELCRQA